tara:strand:- start:184 stop:318 length:135 start_codon:yes stop_codon:yes gene_type:complete
LYFFFYHETMRRIIMRRRLIAKLKKDHPLENGSLLVSNDVHGGW